MTKIGRNDPCPCGSGKKYKKCCLRKEVSKDDDETSKIKPEEMKRIGKIKNKAINFMFRNFEKEIDSAIINDIDNYPYPMFGEDTYIDRVNFLDWFLLEREIKDGKTPMELFLDSYELPNEVKKELFMPWRNPIYGLFKIVKKGKYYIKLYDEINREFIDAGVTSIEGAGKLKEGDYLITRLVSWKDFYLLSGAQGVYSVKDDKFKAWVEKFKETQKARVYSEIYMNFVDFFGTDEIIGSSDEIETKISDFQEKFAVSTGGITLPKFKLLNSFKGEKDIGCIVDKNGVLNFFRDYGLFKKIFDGIEKIKDNEWLIMLYLERDFTKLPFEKIRNARNAINVFKWLFGSNFDMNKHFNAMIEKYEGKRNDIKQIEEKVHGLIEEYKRSPEKFIDTIEKDIDVILLPKPEKASFYLNLVRDKLTFKNQELGIECLKIARRYFEDIEDIEGIAETYASEGSCYRKLGDFQTSIKFENKAIEITKDNNLRCKIYLNLSCDYLNMKKYDECINYCEEGMKILSKIDDSKLRDQLLFSFYVNLGSAHMEVKNYEKAIGNYEKAIELSKKIKNKELLPKVDNLKQNLLVLYSKVKSKSEDDLRRRFILLSDVLSKLKSKLKK